MHQSQNITLHSIIPLFVPLKVFEDLCLTTVF